MGLYNKVKLHKQPYIESNRMLQQLPHLHRWNMGSTQIQKRLKSCPLSQQKEIDQLVANADKKRHILAAGMDRHRHRKQYRTDHP